MPSVTPGSLSSTRIPDTELPPESIRRRSQGSNPDPQLFLDIGRRCRDDMCRALESAAIDWTRFTDVLDFGCGCGRTLRWMADQSTRWNLHGTDVDAEAVAWCQRHLPFATCDVNGDLPPLRHADGAFDFIYALAVFTHLDRTREALWLQELARITKPGGVVLLTVFGQHAAAALTLEQRVQLATTGMVFMHRPEWKGLYPDWFGLAYHTEAHVHESYGRFFDVQASHHRGLNNHLDLIVCRTR